jgi:hypothetical protein
VTRWEIFAMRLFFAIALNSFLPAALGFAEQPHPVGIAQWINLTWLSNIYSETRLVLGLLSVLYVIGAALPVVLPLMAAIHIGVLTLYNSQGFVTHTWQVASQVLLVQALVVVFFALWPRLARRPYRFAPGVAVDSYWLYFSQGIIAAGYVTSGVCKLIRSDGRWLLDLPNVPLALLRTRLHDYYTHPTGVPPPEPPLAGWLIDHPQAAIWLFGPGLFIELFAFLALRNRLFALLTGLAILAMHEGISRVMDLNFAVNEDCVLIFLVNVPWWLWWLWRGRKQNHA